MPWAGIPWPGSGACGMPPGCWPYHHELPGGAWNPEPPGATGSLCGPWAPCPGGYPWAPGGVVVGGGGVGGDSVVRVGGSIVALPPVAGSASIASAAMAIGAIASAAGATGSAIAGSYRSAPEPPAPEPPATEPPASEPPASEPLLGAGGCRLASTGAVPAADGSRIRAGSQLLRSAADGYAADRSVRNWVAVGLRLGSRDRLRLISGRRLSGTLSMLGLPCTTR